MARSLIYRDFPRLSFTGPVLEVGAGKDDAVRKLFGLRPKVVTVNIYPQNKVDAVACVTCLPYKDASFGCVICEHVLEHVTDPPKAVSEICRVLKPNGLLVLSAPFSWPIHKKPFDLWRFTEDGLRVLLTPAFRDLRFVRTGAGASGSRLVSLTARKAASPRTRKGGAKAPKISVIMPTYDRAHMISRAIKSIQAQTISDWELVIISDGSKDNTRRVVARFKDPRIRFFHQKNRGLASARNNGLRRARGRYITYCDDDDTLMPYHLKTLSEYLDRCPEVEWVKGQGVTIRAETKIRSINRGGMWSLMHRRESIKKVGYFNERLVVCSDMDYILRLDIHSPGARIPCVLMTRNLHKHSITRQKSTSLREHALDLMHSLLVMKIVQKHRIFSRPAEYVLAAFIFMADGEPLTSLEILKAACRLSLKPSEALAAYYLMGLGFGRGGSLSKVALFLKKTLRAAAGIDRWSSCLLTRDVSIFAYLYLTIIEARAGRKRQARRFMKKCLEQRPCSDRLKTFRDSVQKKVMLPGPVSSDEWSALSGGCDWLRVFRGPRMKGFVFTADHTLTSPKGSSQDFANKMNLLYKGLSVF